MLVTTIEQVRSVVGSAIAKENVYEKLKPYLEQAEEDLEQLVGIEQLAALEGTLTAATDKKLKSLVIKAIVWNGYQLAWVHTFYNLGGAGVTRSTPKDTAALFRYQEEGLRKDIIQKADDAIERLMEFLELHQSSFPIWKESATYTANYQYLISGAADLYKALPELSKSHRMYQLLRGYMDRVERDTVAVIMGTALYNDLKTKRATGTALDAIYQQLHHLANAYIAPATLAEALPWIRVEFTPNGIRIHKVFNNLHDENPVTEEQLFQLQNLLAERAEDAKVKLRKWLNDTASATVLPEYFNSHLYRAPGTSRWTAPDNAGKKHFRIK